MYLVFYLKYVYIYIYIYTYILTAPLAQWSEFLATDADSRHYQIFREVMGLERGPLSLVSTTEELLDRKVAAPV
jgi:hypothetical protein